MVGDIIDENRVWRFVPLALALKRQRQAELFDFKASLIYIVSSRTTRVLFQKQKCVPFLFLYTPYFFLSL